LRVERGDLWLRDLPRRDAAVAASEVARAARHGFAALILERDEVSLVLPAAARRRLPPAPRGREAGPYRLLTLDLPLVPSVVGYLRPALDRLADAGIPVVVLSARRRDHILLRARDARRGAGILRALVAKARRAAAKKQA